MNRLRNLMLILLSYAFYSYADWRFSFLLLALTISTFCAGRWMFSACEGKYAKAIAGANVMVCLGVLGFFKYMGFFVQQVEAVMGGQNSLLSLDEFTRGLIVPLGVSFYCFMAVSYTIDNYRRQIVVQPSFVEFAAYLSFFPHLLAGPIDRGREMLPQLRHVRTFSYDLATDGVRQILCGLFKKVVIADTAAIAVNNVWGEYAGVNSWLLIAAAVLYSVQIYADFSGYSDMAIGVGKLFGIRMRRNFAYPYFSRNVSEFWRGWHMSLTSWFTEYLYIPMGGSRCGKMRTIFNTLVVFTLCGLWHGANWTYMVWGFLCGALFIPLLLFPSLKSKWKEVPLKLQPMQVMCMFLTFSLITLCWIFFRASSLSDAIDFLEAIVSNMNVPIDKGILGREFSKSFCILLLLTFVVEWRGRNSEYPLAPLAGKQMLLRWFSYLILFLLILSYNTETGTFIYQTF